MVLKCSSLSIFSRRRRRTRVRVDGFVCAARWGVVVVRTQVDVDVLVAIRVGTDQPSLDDRAVSNILVERKEEAHIELRALDRRDRPLDGVSGPLEGAGVVTASGGRRPRHLQLHDGGIRASLDDGVQLGAVRHELDELPIDDLELCGGRVVAEDSIAGGVHDLGAEVLMEIRVLLSSQNRSFRHGHMDGLGCLATYHRANERVARGKCGEATRCSGCRRRSAAPAARARGDGWRTRCGSRKTLRVVWVGHRACPAVWTCGCPRPTLTTALVVCMSTVRLR